MVVTPFSNPMLVNWTKKSNDADDVVWLIMFVVWSCSCVSCVLRCSCIYQLAELAFRSLLIIKFDESTFGNIDGWDNIMKNRSKDSYNYTYGEDEPV